MKKLLAFLLVFTLGFVLYACGDDEEENGNDNGNGEVETGDYTPGMYFGYTDGHQNTFAVLYVDENGFISDIFVDTVYLKSEEGGPVSWEARGNEHEGYATTKRSLDHGCGYNMWPAKEVTHNSDEPGDCDVEDDIMWHKQVDMLVADIIENQAIIDYSIDEDGDFEEEGDVIAGVTITVSSYLEAIENALAQAAE